MPFAVAWPQFFHFVPLILPVLLGGIGPEYQLRNSSVHVLGATSGNRNSVGPVFFEFWQPITDRGAAAATAGAAMAISVAMTTPTRLMVSLAVAAARICCDRHKVPCSLVAAERAGERTAKLCRTAEPALARAAPVEKHINAMFLRLGLRDHEDTNRHVTAALIYRADPGSTPREAASRTSPRTRLLLRGGVWT